MTGSADDPGTRVALDGVARLLLAEESLQSVLQRVVDLVKQVMPEGAEVSITVMRDQHATTAASTGDLARHLDQMQYEQGFGPCMEAVLGGQFVEVTDGRTEDRWPEYIATFLRQGASSSLAVPVPAAQLAAALNVYAPVAGAFTDEHRHAVTEFAAYAAVALSNVDALQDAREQAENLRAAMGSRAVIEQAKGIVMERYRVTADEGFRLLVAVSMHTNRKLRDLAEHLVLTGELPALDAPGRAGAPARGRPRHHTSPTSRPRRAQPPPNGNADDRPHHPSPGPDTGSAR